MRNLVNFKRRALAQIGILIDWVTCPVTPVRSTDRRAELKAQSANLSLYMYRACPYCLKTYCTIRRLGLDIELRNTRNNPRWKQQLISGGGRYQVPCLCISNDDGSIEWMYESDDINRYLYNRFGED